MIYIVIFIVSIFFAFFAFKNIKKKRLFKFLSLIAIILPSLLAGFRDYSIGTDINIYVLPAYNDVINTNSFSAYLDLVKWLDLDILYTLFNYIVVIIFKNCNVLLFFISFTICSLFYCGAYKYKEKISPVLTYSLFLLMYYNMSLNIIRQSISLAIIFFSLKYLDNNKTIKFCIAVLIASLFHSTAAIALILLLIKKISISKNKIIYSCIYLLILVVSLLFFNNILSLLNLLHIIPDKYILRYSISKNTTLDINLADTIIRVYVWALMLLEYPLLKKKKDNLFYVLTCLSDILLLQIGNLVPYAYRMSLYFNIVNLIYIPYIIRVAKKYKVIFLISTVLLYFAYFVYMYLIVKNGETYPYIFINS